MNAINTHFNRQLKLYKHSWKASSNLDEFSSSSTWHLTAGCDSGPAVQFRIHLHDRRRTHRRVSLSDANPAVAGEADAVRCCQSAAPLQYPSVAATTHCSLLLQLTLTLCRAQTWPELTDQRDTQSERSETPTAASQHQAVNIAVLQYLLQYFSVSK